MNNKVKIICFNRRVEEWGDAETALEELLDEGYVVVGQCEFNEKITYTLVKSGIDLNMIVARRDASGSPPPAFQTLNSCSPATRH